MGPKGRWIEIQIRSERMDEIAEKGYAAHYKYKQGITEENSLDRWLNQLKEALENAETDAVDFVEDFKLSLYAKEIYIFTPKGEIKSLPKGATALDFAFAIHSEVGLRTRGTRVNGRLVPLNHVLASGDQVEVITSENKKPSVSWLDYVTTTRAKNKIKSSLNEDTKRIAEDGKEQLQRKLKHLKVNLDEKTVNEMVAYFKLKTSQDLFYRIGAGVIDNVQLKEYAANRNNSLFSFFKKTIKRAPSIPVITDTAANKTGDLLVFGKDNEKLDYKLATCCNPIPGDDAFGFVTINEGIKVHKTDCPNAISMRSNYAYRIIQAHWVDSKEAMNFEATINITGLDSAGLTTEITKIIIESKVINIRSISLSENAGIFKGSITVIVPNNDVLKKMMGNLKKIEGIEKVTRVNPS